MTISSELLKAYEATNYVVDGHPNQIVLRIHEYSPQLKEVLQRYGAMTAAYITAYNPFSQQTSREVNERAQAALRCNLEAVSVAVLDGYGQGSTGDWPPEPSLLAVGIDRQKAEMIGRKYRQKAIVWIGAEAVPSLVLLS